MSRLDTAFYELGRLDLLAESDTIIHRLDPRVKVITTLLFIIYVISFDKYEINRLLPFFLFPAFLIGMADLPGATIRLDLRGAGEVYDAFARVRPEGVCHLAANPSPSAWSRQGTFVGNVEITYNVIQAAGDMVSPMLISVATALLLGAPLGIYLATRSDLGATGMWIATGAGETER